MTEKTSRAGASHVLILGGGIAGPVAALALWRAGIPSTLYEAYPGPADGIGGTLALAPNGLAALGLVGADAEVTRVAVPITRQVMAIDDRRIELPRLADLPPLQLIERATLHRILHDRVLAAGIPVEYGKRLVSVDERADRITAQFGDGTTACGDVLIGADGVNSTVRTLIDANAPKARYTGMLSFEAVADHDTGLAPGTMTFTFGRKGYYLYVALPGGATRWGVNLPAERPLSLVEARATSTSEWLATLRDAYAGDTPGSDLLRHTDSATLQVHGALRIMPPVPHWHRGRMVLVGDSVHAPSNSSGQGASLAIESAIELARCLRDVAGVEAAFRVYEGLRRPRVERIAARSAKINHAKAPGPIVRLLMPLLMKMLVRTALKPERALGPEQRYRIDWDRPIPQ